ncbi:MAG: methyltransferase domain-containing protein [Patescibacteria group bacterium]
MQYLFILGNNPELSRAEIIALLPRAKVITGGEKYLAVEADKFDCFKLMKRLGGTIKIGVVLGKNPDYGPILGAANSSAVTGKFKFGVSFYGVKKNNFGLKAKKILKERGISARLVESKEDALSAVIVTKEKCQDFIIAPGIFALIAAVQNFVAFGQRDFGRPASDSLSGMLPPKVARMMVNLAGLADDEVLLDPFCGSGTILAEALDLGFTNLIGADLSAKAVSDTKKNLAWLAGKLNLKNCNLKIEQLNVKQLTEKIPNETINAIVTEPFLGQPMRGNEREETVKKIINELEKLYSESFAQFHQALKAGGHVVIVIPEWHIGGRVMKMDIFSAIERLGFKRLDRDNLIYKREGQKVWRKITIWEK